MSLARQAVRGVAWSVVLGILARGLGLVGTLVLTRYLTPGQFGEVSGATIVVLTANQFSTVGLGQYLISNRSAGRDAAFHATFFHLAFGIAALGATVVLRHPLAAWFHAEEMWRYIPGLALALLFERVAHVPERILVREMRFRRVAVTRSSSEALYTVVSIVLAARGWGAAAIVWANLARYFLVMVLFCGAVDRRDWIELTPLRAATCKAMFRFGLPLSIAAFTGFASRRWDNMLVMYYFGDAVMGAYNFSYNLADIPASFVGEQIGDVLLPSFVRMEADQRRAALTRAAGLLALLIFPLGVGFAAVAPSVVQFLGKGWNDVASMLTILCVLSLARPIAGTISSYLMAIGRTRMVMSLEVSKLGMLLLAIALAGRTGPLYTCGAVALAFLLHAFASLWAVKSADQVATRPILVGMLPPLAACVPLAVCVAGLEKGGHFIHLQVPGRAVLQLAVEVIAGALVYVGSALILARATSLDFLRLVRNALRR